MRYTELWHTGVVCLYITYLGAGWTPRTLGPPWNVIDALPPWTIPPRLLLLPHTMSSFGVGGQGSSALWMTSSRIYWVDLNDCNAPPVNKFNWVEKTVRTQTPSSSSFFWSSADFNASQYRFDYYLYDVPRVGYYICIQALSHNGFSPFHKYNRYCLPGPRIGITYSGAEWNEPTEKCRKNNAHKGEISLHPPKSKVIERKKDPSIFTEHFISTMSGLLFNSLFGF